MVLSGMRLGLWTSTTYVSVMLKHGAGLDTRACGVNLSQSAKRISNIPEGKVQGWESCKIKPTMFRVHPMEFGERACCGGKVTRHDPPSPDN